MEENNQISISLELDKMTKISVGFRSTITKETNYGVYILSM